MTDKKLEAFHKKQCFEHFREKKLKQSLKSMDEAEKKSIEESFAKNVRILENRMNNIKTELGGCTRILGALVEVTEKSKNKQQNF